MISIQYMGRLGNNMFQRAAAEILSQKSGLKVQDGSIDGIINKNSNELVIDSPTLTLDDDSFYCKTAFLNNLLDPAPRGIRLHGFFQKSWMALDHRNFLKDFFRLPEQPFDIKKEDVAVCIRRDDMLEPCQKPNLIPYEYYEYVIETYFKNHNFYIFTDSPNDIDVQKLCEKYSISQIAFSRDAALDLSTLTKFNNIIGGAGTYYWWGAFLGEAKNIYFPIHHSGWGIETRESHVDLYLPFVNYIHHSNYANII